MVYSLVFILLIAFALFKSLQDNEVRNGNNRRTWKQKYYMPLTKGIHWYYFGLYTPIYKERFMYSSTILVSLTDNWHLYGSLRDLSLICAGSVLAYGLTIKTLIIVICVKVFTSVLFEIHFKYIK